MSETAYHIIPQPNSTYDVEVATPNSVSRRSIRRGPSGFKSEAAAEAWIAKHKRMEGRQVRL
jgi:hypothetical protein